MSSRSVVKSQRRCHAGIFGTTRSAEASWKYLLGYRPGERSHAPLRGEKTNIRWLNAVAVPRDAEHSVAGGLSNEGVRDLLSFLERNYVVDSSVATEAASNT